MENNNIDLDYLDRGIACTVVQFEYLIKKVNDIDYKYVEELNLVKDQFENVESDNEYQKIASSFSDLRSKIIKDPLYKENREVFLVITEIDYLNNALIKLLQNNNGSHEISKVAQFISQQFETSIREILTINDTTKVLSKEATEILKILVKEKQFNDIEEGINLVVSLTELNKQTFAIYEKLAQAHILAVYYDLLKQKD